MKAILLSAAAVAAFATPTLAREPEVEIRDTVARVAVIIENRRDVAIEIEQGSSGLPPVQVSRLGDKYRIDGGLDGRNRIQNCNSNPDAARPGDGAVVQVRGTGRVNVADAPLIVIRTPAEVDVSAGGAVYGSVGRGARSVELGVAGCGDWDVANTEGPVSLSIGGSGSVRAGATGPLEVSIGGSGDVAVASIQGDMEVAIGGSGDILVRGGAAPNVEISIAGSGDVRFDGTAGDVEATIVGGGDVTIARATGRVSRTIMGGGEVRVGS